MYFPFMVLNSFEGIYQLPGYVVAITFFTPIILGMTWYFYKTRHARSWRKGILPPKLKFTEDNLLEAYLSLGARLILLDYKSSKGKTLFINEYFNRYFKSSNYDFGDSLLFSLRHPIQIETASSWLKAHLKDEGARAQVIYFLTGLALIDGTIHRKEVAFLEEMNRQLGLSPGNLKRIIAIYQSYHKTKKKEEAKSKQSSRPAAKVNNYREILGVSSSADAVEIKKAYRKMVKLHHPDVFATASDAQKRMAEARFIKIQEAYEGLTL